MTPLDINLWLGVRPQNAWVEYSGWPFLTSHVLLPNAAALNLALQARRLQSGIDRPLAEERPARFAPPSAGWLA